MVTPLHVAKSVVEPALKQFLAERRRGRERSLPLSELVNVTVRDDLKRRRAEREIEAILDTVVERIKSVRSAEWRSLSSADREAAQAAVIDTFASGGLADEAFFAADADPVKLSRQLRARLPDLAERAGLSEAGTAYYRRLLGECCVIYVQLVIHLASFPARGISVLLDRTSSLSIQFTQIIDRLPVRSLDAPAGSDFDDEFRQRYLTHISTTMDVVDLFGIDFRRYEPRTTLSVAYIGLSATTQGTDPRKPARLHEQIPPEAVNSSASVRVESALIGSKRLLIRGEAGSGKTTLLRWLMVTG